MGEVPECLYFGILLGILNFHPDSSALRTIKTSASDGDATNHVIGRNLIQESCIGRSHIWSTLQRRPLHVLAEGILKFEVTNLVAIGIVVEQAVEANTLFACYEGTQRSFRLETTAGTNTYEGKLAKLRIVLASFEIDICQSIPCL